LVAGKLQLPFSQKKIFPLSKKYIPGKKSPHSNSNKSYEHSLVRLSLPFYRIPSKIFNIDQCLAVGLDIG
jgi:hypothetical protein